MSILIFFCDLISFLIVAYVIYIMLRPMLFGAIYFPTTPGNVGIIRKFADAKSGQKIADLGSGDGRILIALAQAGAEAHGYEVNPLLVWNSRRAIRKAGLKGKAIVHWQSFWKADLSQYDTIVTYGFPHIMGKLGKKLKAELAPDAKVISNVFTFPNLTEVRSENKVRLYTISH
jgi:cyclopropane fatty-acyl-phospholipid synthase-like methyltransferase